MMAKRKRRSRSKADVLGAAVLRDVRAKRRTFLREVSELLSVALGFQVKVALASPAPDLSPEQRKASRRSAKANRRQIAESAAFGVLHPQTPFDFNVVDEPDGSTTYWIPEADDASG